MKTKILFSYTESIIPKGCRKARNTSFDDGEVTINIREIAAADAPVAIRANGKFDFDQLSPYEIEYRWWKGRLWTSLSVFKGKPASHSAQSDWNYELVPETLDLRGGGRLYNPGIYSGESNNRQKNIDAMRAQLDNLVLIDGVMHRTAGEPCYKVMTFGLGSNRGGTALMLDCAPEKRTKGNSEYLFGLLDRETAIEAATETATERGDTKNLPIVPHGPQFEVLITEAIKLRIKQPKARITKPKVVLGISSAARGAYF